MLSYELNWDLRSKSDGQLMDELNDLRKEITLVIRWIPQGEELKRLVACMRRAVILSHFVGSLHGHTWHWVRLSADMHLVSEKRYRREGDLVKVDATVIAYLADSHYSGPVPEYIY